MNFFNRLREDVWLPILMPFWWKVLAAAGVGLLTGVALCYYTLSLRGLL